MIPVLVVGLLAGGYCGICIGYVLARWTRQLDRWFVSRMEGDR